MRAFLRRGKFAPQHSEMEDFFLGRITRPEGMAHIRDAVRASVRGPARLRHETLHGLRAWDMVYLDQLAAGRLVPGENTAASEPLQGLNANEALLIRQANSKRLLRNLPPIIQKSLQARVKKINAAWEQDAREYDRLFPEPKAEPREKRKKKSRVRGRKPAAQKARKKPVQRKRPAAACARKRGPSRSSPAPRGRRS